MKSSNNFSLLKISLNNKTNISNYSNVNFVKELEPFESILKHHDIQKKNFILMKFSNNSSLLEIPLSNKINTLKGKTCLNLNVEFHSDFISNEDDSWENPI
jgi:hypothetical protein